MDSPVKEKLLAQQSVKVMLTAFWDMKRPIIIDFLEKDASLNSASYCQLVKQYFTLSIYVQLKMQSIELSMQVILFKVVMAYRGLDTLSRWADNRAPQFVSDSLNKTSHVFNLISFQSESARQLWQGKGTSHSPKIQKWILTPPPNTICSHKKDTLFFWGWRWWGLNPSAEDAISIYYIPHNMWVYC